MWDYARMAQIASKLGGPLKLSAAVLAVGGLVGGIIGYCVRGAVDEQMRHMQDESRRKAQMAQEAQRMQRDKEREPEAGPDDVCGRPAAQ